MPNDKKQSHKKQQDANGLTAKDRVYRAFLANHDVSTEEVAKEAPEHSVNTVGKWLSGARRLWAARIERDQNANVPVETRQLWHKELEDDQTPDQAEGRPKRSFANQSVGRQPDPFRRQQVERAAVEETTRHFTSNGYVVESAETDNVGWDLEAVRGRIKLRLEVKGLSGPDVSVELTPNEYKKMQEYRDSYWLCVVTDALTAPKLTMFAYSKQAGRWEDQDGRPLAIEEVVAARCRAVWN